MELTSPQDLERAIHLMRHAVNLRSAGAREAAAWVAKRAYNIAPRNIAVMNDYAATMTLTHRPHEAKEVLEAVLKVAPPDLINPITHNLGLAHMYAGEYEKALSVFTSVAGRFFDAAWDRMHMQLLLGDYENGFKSVDVRKRRSPEMYPDHTMQEWDGKFYPEDTLWVIGEQGLGDTWQFSRYLKWAKTHFKRLVLSVHPTQTPMFYGYPSVDEVRPISWDMPEPEAQHYVYMFSLPLLHKTTLSTIPPDPGWFKYVGSDPTMHANLTAPDERLLRVGVCWAGNPAHPRDYDRTIPTACLLPLVELSRIQFYSFQVGPAVRDLTALGIAGVITNLEDVIKGSWKATAAGLLQCDVLVTADTATAHLAGAMGVPTWLLLCKVPDWRWLTKRDDSPWYPSITLFRQKKLGDWDEVIDRVKTKLSQRTRNFSVIRNNAAS